MDNPLEFDLVSEKFDPILTETQITELAGRIKSIDPTLAEKVIQDIARVIQEKGATNQAFAVIMQILTGALGLGLKL